MEEINILIIGAGVVGLAVASELSKEFGEVVVVEKEGKFGQHASSRNSEVIHSGIYYPPDSLKARLCTRGNSLLYPFLRDYQIPCRRCGKLVVAVTPEEVSPLHRLQRNGQGNGVRELEILTSRRIKEKEPRIKAVLGLWVPSAGILDTHRLMLTLEMLTEKQKGTVVYNTEVRAIEKCGGGFVVSFTGGEKIKTRFLINSAGLFADGIAEMAGIDPDICGLRLHWAKGAYYKTTRYRDFQHLVYPLPEPSTRSLGIHLTVTLAGEIRFGPNLFYTDNLDYAFDDSFKDEFYREIIRYIDIQPGDLMPDETGIRPKLQGPGDPFRDFYIREETDRGLPGFINLIGIESPGITAALAIGEMVAGKIKNLREEN